MSLRPRWLRRIGRGGYAEVWEIELPDHRQLFAAKRILVPFSSAEVAKNVVHEVLLLNQLQGSCFLPAIRQIFFTHDPDQKACLAIVMERLTSDLRGLFTLRPPAFEYLRRYCLEVVECVAWLHACGVVHSDLKPDNFLICRRGGIRITDFNHAHLAGQVGGLGTRFYRAPELLLHQSYGPATDIWALGCVLLEMVWWWIGRTELPPFWASRCVTLSPKSEDNCLTSDDQLLAVLSLVGCPAAKEFSWIKDRKTRTTMHHYAKYRVRRSVIEQYVDDPLIAELLHGCLRLDPAKRFSAERLLALPIFMGLPRRKEAVRQITLPRGDWLSLDELNAILMQGVCSSPWDL